MRQILQKISMIGVAIAIVAMTVTNTAFAHVVVKPAEVVTAGFQTFTVGVPNEKDVTVTKLKLLIPNGLNYVSPTQKAGWKISVEKTGNGEGAKVSSITWQGGSINAGLRDDFTFSAQVPDKATELQWKAYQTYADGTVVAWDQQAGGEENDISGPLSVTKVVAETEADSLVKSANQAAQDSKDTADTALYIAIAGLLVGVAAIFMNMRKK